MAKAAPAASGKPKAPSKGEVLNSIAETTALSRKQVQSVLDALNAEIIKAVSKKGPGVFQIPGIAKVYVHIRKAQPAKKGWKNPFTGELQDKPAQPAKKAIKIKALKTLKDVQL